MDISKIAKTYAVSRTGGECLEPCASSSISALLLEQPKDVDGAFEKGAMMEVWKRGAHALAGVRQAILLESGWYLIVTDSDVWLNDSPNISCGNGICLGTGVNTRTAQTKAVKALEEVLDELQQPF